MSCLPRRDGPQDGGRLAGAPANPYHPAMLAARLRLPAALVLAAIAGCRARAPAGPQESSTPPAIASSPLEIYRIENGRSIELESIAAAVAPFFPGVEIPPVEVVILDPSARPAQRLGGYEPRYHQIRLYLPPGTPLDGFSGFVASAAGEAFLAALSRSSGGRALALEEPTLRFLAVGYTEWIRQASGLDRGSTPGAAEGFADAMAREEIRLGLQPEGFFDRFAPTGSAEDPFARERRGTQAAASLVRTIVEEFGLGRDGYVEMWRSLGRRAGSGALDREEAESLLNRSLADAFRGRRPAPKYRALFSEWESALRKAPVDEPKLDSRATRPVPGSTGVEPGLSAISLRFDRSMDTTWFDVLVDGVAFCSKQVKNETTRHWRDDRTLVVPLQRPLAAGSRHRISLNAAEPFHAIRDRRGIPLATLSYDFVVAARP